MTEELLAFKDIDKVFPGVRALKNINFSIAKNEIHGIVGENGAGKSTLIKIIAGDIVDYSGDLILQGEKVVFKSPHDAIRAGVSVVYQEGNLCPNLDALRNAFLGREIYKNGRADWARMQSMMQEHLKSLNLDIDINVPIQKYNTPQQQMIEILKATIFENKVLVMDEPTSALNQVEVERLFKLLQKLKSRGVTILFVSHRLNEVLQITDTVTVLRNGEYIDTVETRCTDQNQIVKLMIGQTILHKKKDREIRQREEALSVTAMSRTGEYSNVSFSLRKGEILGIAGLEGSGRFEMGRSLFGLLPYETGEIRLFGKVVRIRNPIDAIRNGIGFISRDRKGEGIFSLMDLVKNMSMIVSLEDALINNMKFARIAREYIEKMNINCSSINQNISSLSGGNQQKSIVSRWLAKGPKVIIMEEPTHGIDVGAKAEMFEIVASLARGGASIIIISSELNELINECDRILIMRTGELTGEVDASATSEQEIMTFATGIKSNEGGRE
jgi:ribose transport system ATP-binding protein